MESETFIWLMILETKNHPKANLCWDFVSVGENPLCDAICFKRLQGSWNNWNGCCIRGHEMKWWICILALISGDMLIPIILEMEGFFVVNMWYFLNGCLNVNFTYDRGFDTWQHRERCDRYLSWCGEMWVDFFMHQSLHYVATNTIAVGMVFPSWGLHLQG